MFDLQLLKQHNVEQVNIDGKRHYVVDNKPKKFDSVTSFLSFTDNQEHLHEWKWKVGQEESDKVSKDALVRGHKVHSYFEDYILGKDVVLNDFPEIFHNIKKHLDEKLTTVYGVELKLFSENLMLAGTTDLFGVYKNKNSIVDFKGSKKLKKIQYIDNYIIQTLIYAKMVEEIYGIEIEQLVILVGVEDFDKAQEFIIDKSKFAYYERELGYKLKKRERMTNDKIKV